MDQPTPHIRISAHHAAAVLEVGFCGENGYSEQQPWLPLVGPSCRKRGVMFILGRFGVEPSAPPRVQVEAAKVWVDCARAIDLAELEARIRRLEERRREQLPSWERGNGGHQGASCEAWEA